MAAISTGRRQLVTKFSLHVLLKPALALAVLLLPASLTAVNAQTTTPVGKFETKGKRAILMDSEDNLVFYEKDADTSFPPASMSKLMTMAVVFRDLKAGRIKLEDQFKVSEHAWRTGGAPSRGSAMFAPLNAMISVNDLIQGAIVQSGNDACIVLAEGVSGSEEAFVKEMNKHAKEIGLTHSHFVNSSGLSAKGHVMSARDLAILANHLIKTYPEYYHYFSQKEFTFNKHTFRNRNPLIWEDLGVDGLKTGYLQESGYGLVASAKRGDQRVIEVVAGLETKNEREDEPKKLLEWGFKNFKPYRLFDKGQQISDALVWGGEARYVPLLGEDDIEVILPVTTSGKITAQIVYQGPIKAPIRKGDKVASLRITADDTKATNEIPLYAGADIAPSNFAWRGIDSLLVLAFGWIL